MIKLDLRDDKCPFCKNVTPIGSFRTEKSAIFQCSTCLKVWELYNGGVGRLLNRKRIPDEHTPLHCPICLELMEPNWDEWVYRCPDPICAYQKRIPGLNPEQRRIKKLYISTRTEIFELMSEGNEIPEGLAKKFKNLQLLMEEVRRYDHKAI